MVSPRSAFGASPQGGAPLADRQSRIRGGRLAQAIWCGLWYG